MLIQACLDELQYSANDFAFVFEMPIEGRRDQTYFFGVLAELRTKAVAARILGPDQSCSSEDGFMIISDYIQVVAGSFILISLALGVEASPLFISKYWLWFTAFVGANLLQSGFSKFCPLAIILKKLGVPEK